MTEAGLYLLSKILSSQVSLMTLLYKEESCLNKKDDCSSTTSLEFETYETLIKEAPNLEEECIKVKKIDAVNSSEKFADESDSIKVDSINVVDLRFANGFKRRLFIPTLSSKINSLVNKVTLENYEIILAETMLLEITSLDHLNMLISAIVDAACNTKHFAEMYASFIKSLSVEFKMRSICNENGSFVIEKLVLEYIKSKVKAAKCTWHAEYAAELLRLGNTATAEALIESGNINEEILKRKINIIGLYTLIGVLYKLQFAINFSDIQQILKRLLGKETIDLVTAEELELACVMLNVAGPHLEEKESGNEIIQGYFRRIQLFGNFTKESRLKCMCQNLHFLRLNNWKSSKIVEEPAQRTSIEKVRKELEKKPNDLVTHTIKSKKTNANSNSNWREKNSKLTKEFVGIPINVVNSNRFQCLGDQSKKVVDRIGSGARFVPPHKRRANN